MLKRFWGAVSVVGLIAVGGGVAAADPVKVADVTHAVDTGDGYHLSASLTEMIINSVPNMAATAFSREAFVSGTATETIYGGKERVTEDAQLELLLVMGCQIDIGNGGFLNLSGPVSFGNVLTNILAPMTAISANPIAGLTPSGTLNLQPGTITYLKINEKKISSDIVNDRIRASGQFSMHISVHDAYVQVDACGGPVSVRLVATAQMSTNNSDDESNVFGGIVSI